MAWKQYVILITSIVINFIMFAETRDALTHINWKSDIQDPKHWLAYVYKGLELMVMDALNETKIVTDSLNQIRIKQNSFRRLVSIISHAQFACNLQPETKTAPIISLKISWFGYSCFDNPLYKLMFKLNKQLSLNITFNKLFTRDYFGYCFLYHLTVAFGVCGDKCFKYCGMLSHFSVFPPSRNVSFHFSYIGKKPIFIDVMCHVMSAQLIQSQRTENLSFTLMFVYLVPLNKRLITTYRILVKKDEKIRLFSYRISRKVDLIIFDGPGFLSPVYYIQNGKINVSTATFQCVVQVIHHEYKEEKNIFSPLNYLAESKEKKKIHMKNKSEIVQFPDDLCLEPSCLSALLLHSTQNVYLNITIHQFLYMGEPSSKCYLGGFAFLDFAFHQFEETLLMCNRHPNSNLFETSHHQRNILSRNSSVIIILYQYKEYSSIQFSASIQLSNCFGLKIHPCSLRNFKEHDEEFLPYSHFIRLRRRRRGTFAVSVSQTRCIAFQFSTEIDWKVSGSFSQPRLWSLYCSLTLEFKEIKAEKKLWEMIYSGFFPRSLLEENHMNIIGAIEHTSIQPIITEWNKANNNVSSGCHYFKRERPINAKMHPMCGLFSCLSTGFYMNCYLKSKKSFAATFFMKYFVITPVFSETLRFCVDLQYGSTGWVNVILNPTDETPSNTYIELIHPEELLQGSRYFQTEFQIR